VINFFNHAINFFNRALIAVLPHILFVTFFNLCCICRWTSLAHCFWML